MVLVLRGHYTVKMMIFRLIVVLPLLVAVILSLPVILILEILNVED